MEEFWMYQVRVAIALLVFYLMYQLLFSYRKHFVFNRLYLAFSMALSFLLPFITFTIVREAAPSFVILEDSTLQIVTDVSQSAEPLFDPFQFSLVVYLFGLLYFLVRLITGHLRALYIIKKCHKRRINNQLVSVTPEEIHPFAFYNKVVVPDKALTDKALPLILRHERIHIREHHWMDNLMSEIICALQWFNPFSWLLKNALKTNLEFRADEKTSTPSEAETYQIALVSMASHRGIGTFLTALNSSNLKKRITMMKKKTEFRYAWMGKLAILPLLAILVTGLSKREYSYTTISPTPETLPQVKQTTLSDNLGEILMRLPADTDWDQAAKEKATVQDHELKGSILTNTPGFQPSDQMPVFPGGEEALKDFISKNIRYPRIALENGIQGKVSVSFIVSQTGSVKDARVVNGVDPSLDKEALRVINSMPAWKPGRKDGHPVDVSYTVPVNFELPPDTKRPVEKQLAPPGNPLYIVDGVEYKGNISDLNVADIKEVSVLKGESAMELYGEGAAEGAIVIKTKNKDPLARKEPLIFVDGVKTSQDIKDIDPNTIESISVLKGSSAAGYGKEGENGIILIQLKKAGQSEEPTKILTGERLGNVSTNQPPVTSMLELRRSLAYGIKYPVEAQRSGQQGKVILYARYDENGILKSLSESEPEENPEILDEIVVVGYKPDTPALATNATLKPLTEESKRVLMTHREVNIPEFKGKWIKMQFNFALQ
jgi:TonB family protein